MDEEEEIDIGKLIVEGLEEMVQNLKNKVPIEAVRVTRIKTPDGPMHTREYIVLNTEEEEDASNT